MQIEGSAVQRACWGSGWIEGGEVKGRQAVIARGDESGIQRLHTEPRPICAFELYSTDGVHAVQCGAAVGDDVRRVDR